MRLFALAFLTIFAAFSQTTDAVLGGTLTDSSEAVVPEALVAARNTNTGVVSRTKTNAAGVYVFAALPPGPYSVTAERTGFRKAQVNNLVLEVGGRVTRTVVLELGNVTEMGEVREEQVSLSVATSSVGGVLSGAKITTLPLTDRDVLGLVYTQAGLVGDNFAGSRISAVNVTLDGINVQDNRYHSGVTSVFKNSTDAIEEVRIVTSPADAEFGRGSGQIQMVSKSGTNALHGAVFEQHRNTALNANNFFNNLRGRDKFGNEVNPRDFLIRNQFGGHISGPIVKNKTFFFFLFEGDRIRSHETVNSKTYTATARQGLFRFFPGARNANANGAAPTVDANGNPVKPANATNTIGDLQTVSVLGRDPLRLTADPTIGKLINSTPLPNDFRSGDGLNVAGYRWQRSSPDDLRKFQFRIDHNFNEKHRLNWSFNTEHQDQVNGFMPQPYPTAQTDLRATRANLNSFGFVSAISSNLINEFHAGAQRAKYRLYAPWELSGTDLLPRMSGLPFLYAFPAAASYADNSIDTSNDPQGRLSPVYQASDNVTYLRGKHAVKAGVELRFVSSNGFNSFGVMPRANIGAGGVPVTNITGGGGITGIGSNANPAQNLLLALSGSIASIDQSYNSPGGKNPVYLPGETKQRTWRTREMSWFVKDDYKLTPNILLNIGMRYEYYGVPYDANGKTASLVGGSRSIFGISGTTFGDVFQPGKTAGSLTQIQQVGPNSPNPDKSLFAADRNNFAPAVGISWNLPKGFTFGRNVVFRTGYGMGYERHSLRLVDIIAGDEPGLNTDASFRSATLITAANGKLPVQVNGIPLSTIPVTERVQDVKVFDSRLRAPYIQNWNATMQFELNQSTSMDLRYVGSKGTRLMRGTNINEVNIVENGVLDAFKALQVGTCPALIQRLGNATNCNAMQNNSIVRQALADNNVGEFADFLNRNTFQTGQVGGLIRRAGLPENFIVANPQFFSANLYGNYSNSTYHSLQVEVLHKFSKSFDVQSNLTYSKSLGDDEGNTQDQLSSYRTLRDRHLDRRLLDSHRTFVFRNSGTWELPFGPGKKFLSSKNGIVSRIFGGWNSSFIFNTFSGQPMDLTVYTTSFNDVLSNTPVAIGPLSKGLGSVNRTGDGVVYFSGLTQVADPSIANYTAALKANSTMSAITDASGKIILTNPLPGQLGSVAPRFLTGPAGIRLDVNMVKKIKINERVTFSLRADVENLTNTPYFDNPITDINDPDFGRITSASGNRIVVVGARIQF